MARPSAARPRRVAASAFAVWLLMVILTFSLGVRGPRPGYLPAGAGLAGKVIVVDPGHGGRDPGTNRGQYLEKDIVLEIGLLTRDLLQAAGAVVFMTRETDIDHSEPIPGQKKFTDLAARARMVADVAPDAFLSIHVNSFPESKWRGAQVFYNPKLEANHLLACALQAELSQACGVSREVAIDRRQYLLKEINVPGACAEVGFITNPEDLALITGREGQDRIAWALCVGLARFLEQAVWPAGSR